MTLGNVAFRVENIPCARCSEKGMLSTSRASCTDCRSQSQLFCPVSAEPSYSLWAISAFQPWKGSKGSNPSLCWQCLHTGVKALVGVHSMAEGWAGGCHWHGLCSPCVSGAAVQDWYILLILEGWYHCLGMDLRSY